LTTWPISGGERPPKSQARNPFLALIESRKLAERTIQVDHLYWSGAHRDMVASSKVTRAYRSAPRVKKNRRLISLFDGAGRVGWCRVLHD
jgi:hypothetical protein